MRSLTKFLCLKTDIPKLELMVEISLKVIINLNLVTLHNRLEKLQRIAAYCDYWFEHNVQTMSKTMYGAITSVNLCSTLHIFLKRIRKWNFQNKMNVLIYYFKVYSLFSIRTPTFAHAYHSILSRQNGSTLLLRFKCTVIGRQLSTTVVKRRGS